MKPSTQRALFIVPWVISFLLFSAYPIVFSLGVSFAEYNPFKGGLLGWAGLANYRAVFADGLFWQSFGNTIFFVLGTVPPTAVLSLLLALLIERAGRARGFLRTGYFVPSVVSLAVISLVFKYVYAKQGMLNLVLGLFGAQGQEWLLNPRLALPSIMVMDIWASIGYYAIFYLAALQTVPRELYDAARVDGAGWWSTFRSVTLPWIRPVVVFVAVVNTIRAFQVFVEVVIMTRGGPMGSTMTLVYYMYEKAFHSVDMGAASSVAFIVFVLITIFALVQVKLIGRMKASVG
ncbi:carbohydrate ABC transporter permease [Candidatus Eisenbacteria bacterium]|uniref:Carbohydrate ABC transporter permease n=1 Tax=Eiseniibacteriota bacterium TaxID=2212470 RepID=A0ABV6YNH7_UNCEI